MGDRGAVGPAAAPSQQEEPANQQQCSQAPGVTGAHNGLQSFTFPASFHFPNLKQTSLLVVSTPEKYREGHSGKLCSSVVMLILVQTIKKFFSNTKHFLQLLRISVYCTGEVNFRDITGFWQEKKSLLWRYLRENFIVAQIFTNLRLFSFSHSITNFT